LKKIQKVVLKMVRQDQEVQEKESSTLEKNLRFCHARARRSDIDQNKLPEACGHHRWTDVS
jgi:hypothetical protein